jgi:hypothetical protein
MPCTSSQLFLNATLLRRREGESPVDGYDRLINIPARLISRAGRYPMICKHQTCLQAYLGTQVQTSNSRVVPVNALEVSSCPKLRLNPASLIGSILTTFRLIAAIAHDRGPRPGSQIRTICESYSQLSLSTIVTLRGQPR